MQIIGAGFGRTGTMSLRAALTDLGFGPCYHMMEVLTHPSHIGFWQRASDGEHVDWKEFLSSYRSGLDYPLSAFYKELMEIFPDARVVLTVRDPERWYESTTQTIYRGSAIPPLVTRLLPIYGRLQPMVEASVWQGIFDGRFQDRDYAIQRFNEHIEEVIAHVPPEKLLVFDVQEGWQPLCDFLGVPVPSKPFPHINDRKMTNRMYRAAQISAILLLAAIGALLVGLLRLL